MKLKNHSFFCLLVLILMACNPSDKEQKKPIYADPQKLKDQFAEANKLLAKKEDDDLNSYVKSHQKPFIRTNSGIRYHVYEASAKGDSIKNGDNIKMDFRVSLLDGTEVYSSKAEGPKIFEVGGEAMESGIHMGVQHLKNGDKAVFLIPSHLAHGLLGDRNKIPPQMPIVYDVHIIDVRKNPAN